jgi:hypothetical protein
MWKVERFIRLYSCPIRLRRALQKIYAPFSSLLPGKYLPFSPSHLRLNIFRLFVIHSLTQLYRYTPEKFLFSTATFKYTYRALLRRIGQEYRRINRSIYFLNEASACELYPLWYTVNWIWNYNNINIDVSVRVLAENNVFVYGLLLPYTKFAKTRTLSDRKKYLISL